MSLFPPSWIVHNGDLRPASAPLLAPGDGLVHCGRGAFETLAAYRGRLFLADEHFSRLRRAALVLELHCPSDAELTHATHQALQANHLSTEDLARVRITLSSPPDGEASWWIEATLPPSHPPVARLVTGPFFRNERSLLVGLKTINYGENVAALRHARECGADETIFSNSRLELCEGTWSNIFVRIGGRWITPPLSSGCLPGITRALVLELFEETGAAATEETLLIDTLERVESAFLTSSLREIQPVAAIDDRTLVLDPLLDKLRAGYHRRILA
ncbi:MAG: aminotransferase class IV [Verrucomicrobiae bacterium]|nr:aminotransferase class IV [Verrucomicrobiae bacterium]